MAGTPVFAYRSRISGGSDNFRTRFRGARAYSVSIPRVVLRPFGKEGVLIGVTAQDAS